MVIPPEGNGEIRCRHRTTAEAGFFFDEVITLKELWLAVDIWDDFKRAGRLYTPEQVGSMMGHARSLGATTVTWIVDEMWSLYDLDFDGQNLLDLAVRSAHRAGLRFHAVFKPQEGGWDHLILPQSMPRPEGHLFWEDLRGLLPITRPFVAAHPEMAMKRWPGDEDPGGPIAEIRLFNDHDEPLNLQAGDVSIWVSRINGTFERYDGDFTLEQSSRWIPLDPHGRTCRVLSIRGLSIPTEQRYVEVRFDKSGFGGQRFGNEYQLLVEMFNDRGERVPETLDVSGPQGDAHVRALSEPVMMEMIRYGRDPAVREFLANPEEAYSYAKETRGYARNQKTRMIRIDERGLVSIARGKLSHLSALLNPAYPEVRKHWLETVRFCLDCGVDAVDIRPSRHGLMQENWKYGYNEPVMEALGGRVDAWKARQIIGEAFTQFMHEAGDLVKSRGRRFGVHLMTNWLRPPDDALNAPLAPMHLEWERWIAELADFATFRGAFAYRPEVVQYAVDCFANACQAADIPLTYQSSRRHFIKQDPLHFDPDRIECIRHDMAYALNHPGVHAYEIYEFAHFSDLDENGELQCNPQFLELTESFGYGSAAATSGPAGDSDRSGP